MLQKFLNENEKTSYVPPSSSFFNFLLSISFINDSATKSFALFSAFLPESAPISMLNLARFNSRWRKICFAFLLPNFFANSARFSSFERSLKFTNEFTIFTYDWMNTRKWIHQFSKEFLFNSLNAIKILENNLLSFCTVSFSFSFRIFIFFRRTRKFRPHGHELSRNEFSFAICRFQHHRPIVTFRILLLNVRHGPPVNEFSFAKIINNR